MSTRKTSIFKDPNDEMLLNTCLAFFLLFQ